MKPGGIGEPFFAGSLDFCGAAQQNFLHISPAKTWIGLQGEGRHPGNDRRGGGSAVECLRVIEIIEFRQRWTSGVRPVEAKLPEEVGGRDPLEAGGVISAGRRDNQTSPGLAVTGAFAAIIY